MSDDFRGTIIIYAHKQHINIHIKVIHQTQIYICTYPHPHTNYLAYKSI